MTIVDSNPTLSEGRHYPWFHLEHWPCPALLAGVAPGEGCLLDTVLGYFTITKQMQPPKYYVLKIWVDLESQIVPASLVYKKVSNPIPPEKGRPGIIKPFAQRSQVA